MRRYLINGSGLDFTTDGFAVPDGTGYVIRQSAFGCQPEAWDGRFIDVWAYTASASSHDTAFGPWWEFFPPFGAGATASTNNSNTLTCTADAVSILVDCPSIPTNLGNQYAQIVWKSGPYALNVPGVGVMAMAQGAGTNGVNGYYAKIINVQGDVTAFNRVAVSARIGPSDFLLAAAKLPYGGPNGPIGQAVTLRLEATTSGGTTTLNVYVDGTLYITTTDTSFTSGRFGVRSDSGTGDTFTLGTFIAGSL